MYLSPLSGAPRIAAGGTPENTNTRFYGAFADIEDVQDDYNEQVGFGEPDGCDDLDEVDGKTVMLPLIQKPTPWMTIKNVLLPCQSLLCYVSGPFYLSLLWAGINICI